MTPNQPSKNSSIFHHIFKYFRPILYFALFSILGLSPRVEHLRAEELSCRTPEKKAPEMVFVRFSADSENSGYKAWRACDGDSGTLWHTDFTGKKAQESLPHWIQTDLGKSFEITGFTYIPRKDASNGTIEKYQLFVSDSPITEKTIVAPVSEGVLVSADAKSDAPVAVVLEKPVTGRFVRLVSLTEANGNQYASCAEWKILSPGYEFLSGSPEVLAKQVFEKMIQEEKLDVNPELIQQYVQLMGNLERRAFLDSIASQIYDPQASILPDDRDPADIVCRRVRAAMDALSAANQDFSKRIQTLETAVRETSVTDVKARFQLFLQLCALRREVLFANPKLDFSSILFVKKHRATFNHLCDQYYGRNLVPGGGIFLLENAFSAAGPTVKNVLENAQVQNGRLQGTSLNSGAFATLALDYDAQTLAFGYAECTEGTEHLTHLDLTRGHWNAGRCIHIFTCRPDGSGLKMITDGTWNDFYPCFLPNDRIAFISERRGGYLRCGRECPNYTLFDMNRDGSQKRCLSYHETNEWSPSVTNDGKILWTRWDYVDRHGCTAHHPWLISLNGSDPRQVHGNFTLRRERADTEMDVRAIPNSSRLIATAGPHHGQNYGSLVIVDPSKAGEEEKDAMAAVKRITPEVGFPESQGGAQVWGFPYPISEDLFLAVADFSMMPGAGSQGGAFHRGDYGIYLLDRFGNRELLYRDPEIGCASPIPFAARPKPTVVPEIVEPGEIPSQEFVALPPRNPNDRPQASVTLVDVNRSLKPLPEGTKIKALRIVQLYVMSVPSGPFPHEVGFREASSGDSVNLVRGVLGTVPVEEDGSAHFTVPAQTEILFQALDENGNAVQSMRSSTYFQPGDQVGCVGCHEPQHQATNASLTLPLAFRRPASVPVPDVEGSRPANFVELVQPILDRHCAECHAKPESKTFSLGREPYVRKFYQSYFNLMQNGYGFHNYGNPVTTTPGEFGALKSPLLPLLRGGHYGVQLSPDEYHRLTLWLDLLSPFYGCYEKENGEAQLRGEKVYPTLE